MCVFPSSVSRSLFQRSISHPIYIRVLFMLDKTSFLLLFFPIHLKSPSYLYFFSHRPPLCAENFRFSEVMRQVIINGAELYTIFVQDDKNSENVFSGHTYNSDGHKKYLYIKISLFPSRKRRL